MGFSPAQTSGGTALWKGRRDRMSATLRSVVCFLCLTAFLAANTTAHVAVQNLFRNHSTHSVVQHEGSGRSCRCCSSECKRGAKHAACQRTWDEQVVSREEDTPLQPDCPCCPDCPCSPQCPCPNGCSICGLAKTICEPIFSTPALEAPSLGILERMTENVHVQAFHSRLFRPPKA